MHSHQLIRHDAQSRTEPHVPRITVPASGSARYDLGSREYARGELRAEIRSDLTGCRLGPGHDPSRRVGFAAEWANALREDPREIHQAAYGAEPALPVPEREAGRRGLGGLTAPSGGAARCALPLRRSCSWSGYGIVDG